MNRSSPSIATVPGDSASGLLRAATGESWDRLPGAICMVDPDWTVLAWSHRLAKWTGLSAAEMIGQPLTGRFPRLAEERYTARLQQLFKDGTPQCLSAALHKYFMPVLLGVGSDAPFMIQEAVISRLSSDPPAALISLDDVTAAFHALTAIRREHAETRAAQSLLQHSQHTLEEKLRQADAANLRLQQELGELQADRQLQEQQTQSLKLLISELSNARQAAEATARAKSDFLANMSHEIRTPLTAVIGLAENLLDPDVTPEERDRAIRTLQRNGTHLLSIVNDVLDVSRMESQGFFIAETECNPAEVVAEVVELLQVRAAANRLSIETRFLTPLPVRIKTDPTRLRQILMNLIGNAIKFTETGGVVLEVCLVEGTATQEPLLQFDIVDSGGGLSATQQASLFQPFFQADNSPTRRHGGTGLGLAISRRLAILLGGDIQVQSQVGQGSRFSVTIRTGCLEGVPRLARNTVSPSLETGITSPPAIPLPRYSGRVLLAEDAEDNRRLICFHLRKAGLDVDIACHGGEAFEQALAALREGTPYGLILMDIQMPYLDGYQATTALRQAGYVGPIVALTANALAGDREKCLAAGCDDYAVKPIDRTRLLQLCGKYLPPSNAVPTPAAPPRAVASEEALTLIETLLADQPNTSYISGVSAAAVPVV